MVLCSALEVSASAKRSLAQRFDTTLSSNSYSPIMAANAAGFDERVTRQRVCRFESLELLACHLGRGNDDLVT
jgi:hypothetical protein